MKLHNVALQNFLTIGTAEVNLADRGLHLIQGVNEDNTSAESNGSGKSSIVDGVSWCFFGVTARGVKGDKVVNRSKKKDCAVATRVSNGASEYTIARFRKHGTHKNALRVTAHTPGGDVDMTKGTDAETQKVVEQILGCSYEVFKAAVYSGQEDMPDLPRKTDKELKMLIEEAAGMSRIERAYDEAKTRRATAKTKLEVTENAVVQAQAAVARTQRQLDDAKLETDEWEAGRALRIQAAQERVDEKTAAVRALAEDLARRKGEYDAAVAEIATIDTQLAEHSNLEATARNAENAANRANQAIEREKLEMAKQAVVRLEAAIAKGFTLGVPCDSCGKPSDEHDQEQWSKHQQERLEQAKQALEEVKGRVATQAAAAVEARKAADTARAAVPDVTAASHRRQQLGALVKRFDDDRQAALSGKTQLDTLKADVEARRTEVNPHGRSVAVLEKQVVDQTAEVAAKVEARDAAKKAMSVAEAVCGVFGPAGVRAQVLDTVTPYLNERTSDYLSVLSDGTIKAIWTTLSKAASGDLKEKFSIEVEDSQGADSFDGLSGGEKRKVRIATALALQDLVASRATQPIDLWIGDEIDDALDQAGLERLMTILERKARERGTVLMISHNPLRDWIDEVTLVRKSGGVSTVEGSLCS